ncbi:MAG: DUF2065 domain-containing protein [Elusimicrobia bacterium]|nr:MAG: DUF2065 domain-containing protein [Gammaproteobacteria bacterium]TXH21919.1 MAG: DUF2065 domain-containing protein [Elusimicrobiota bacterium]
MPSELVSALCLVAVIEGLILFAFPGQWKQAMERMREIEEGRLRMAGGVMIVIGLVALKLSH